MFNHIMQHERTDNLVSPYKTNNCNTYIRAQMHAHTHTHTLPRWYTIEVENIIILKAPSSRCSEYDGDSPTGADDERSRPNVPRADATARRPRPTLDHSASGCAVVPSFVCRCRHCRWFQSSYRSVVSRVCLLCEFSAFLAFGLV